FHLLGRFREHVELIEAGYRSVDHTRSRGGIDLHAHVRCSHPWRDRAQTEVDDAGRVGVLNLQLAYHHGRAGPFLDAEFDAQSVAFVDAEQVESSSPFSKGHGSIRGLGRIVRRNIRLDSCPITAVESIEPCLSRVSGWCVREGGGRRPGRGGGDRQDEQNYESREYLLPTSA